MRLGSRAPAARGRTKCSEVACGWIHQDDVAHDPTMATPQLNIDAFRIRKQFAAAGLIGAANIIERRPRTKQLRIGAARLSIIQSD